jgi:hypothetical protein
MKKEKGKVKNNNNKKPEQAYLSIPPSPSIIYFSSTHLMGPLSHTTHEIRLPCQNLEEL